MKRPSLVAIVGKPNTGKSTLFNRIVGKRRAITHRTPGVTRDSMEERAVWNGVEFTIADTGGYSRDGGEGIQRLIMESVRKKLSDAAVIIFVTDIHTGPTADDEELLGELHADRERILLVVNKVESREDSWKTYEFYTLGLGEMHAISALHGIGVGELLDEIVSRLPRRPVPKEVEPLRIAVVGKPNVGKSSLVNSLVGEDRHIVSEEPGTTRDAVNLRLRRYGREILLVDTAGIKRKSRTQAGLHVISTLKSIGSIRSSDVTLVLLDASSDISRQDTRIAAEAHRGRKGVAVLLNKWDLLKKDPGTHEEFVLKVHRAMPFLSYAPILTISALKGLRIKRILPLCFRIQAAREKHIKTKEINKLIASLTAEKPPAYYKGGSGKIYYATQTGTKPPTFTLFVNRSTYFPRSYIRYINNGVRKMFTFEGTAVRISLRSKGR